MYIDSHAHLTSESVLPQLEEVLQRARAQGVDKIVNICTDAASLEKGIVLAKRHPWIFNTAATPPHDVEKEGELFFPVVEKAAKEKQLVAIGETGLDYYYEHADREIQKAFLIRYFHLALKMDLPVVIHCRAAFADLFALADREYKSNRLLLHCFTGSLEEAKQVLERGWLISFSGIVTFKKSEELRTVLQYVPIDQLLIETDTPYLAPQGKRGLANEPAFLPETAALVAQVKDIDLSAVAAVTSATASSFFSI